jgi:hypothetical protein
MIASILSRAGACGITVGAGGPTWVSFPQTSSCPTRGAVAGQRQDLHGELGGSDALIMVKPTTVVKWRRAGFRRYWTWRSRPRGGRPAIDPEVRALIRRLVAAYALDLSLADARETGGVRSRGAGT